MCFWQKERVGFFLCWISADDGACPYASYLKLEKNTGERQQSSRCDNRPDGEGIESTLELLVLRAVKDEFHYVGVIDVK